MLKELDNQIINLEYSIINIELDLSVKHSKLEQLKERKKSLLNYLNTDNN